MDVYLFALNECKTIYGRNICLTKILSSGTSVIITIDSKQYTAYKNTDGYSSGLYVTVDTIDVNNNTSAIYISECPRGYKKVGASCARIVPTPVGEMTEGEMYFYGIIAVPLILFGLNKLVH